MLKKNELGRKIKDSMNSSGMHSVSPMSPSSEPQPQGHTGLPHCRSATSAVRLRFPSRQVPQHFCISHLACAADAAEAEQRERVAQDSLKVSATLVH